ncbi:hypothetical protein G9P44_005920 [Scheffersomyces stipitis]|nr:hypothetical protein G9P44_005920 [Scheffersomyces stipitis]
MEFHAIILCGDGKALSPFSATRSTGSPKALLPIANKPMLSYVLDWCEKAFFPRVTVVVGTDAESDIQNAVDQYKADKVKENQDKDASDDGTGHSTAIEVYGFDAENSGQIIYQLYKSNAWKPYQNFVILPCDLVTNLPPQVLIEAYRSKDESDLGLIVHYRNQLDIEDKKSKIFDKNYTIYGDVSDGGRKFLDIYSKEDIDFHKALKIRTQMCWRYPQATISTKLLNSCVFFGSEQIFKVFEDNPDKFSESYFKNRSVTKVVRDLARRSWRHSENKESIAFLVVPHQATFFRSCNLPVLMEANRHFMKIQATEKGQTGFAGPKDKTAANVGIDSLIGDNTLLGERTNVKKTVVGSRCNIGKRVKLTGCLVMNNVTIEDDVQLENCIIGNNVLIHSKCKLTNCNVESTNEVARGTQAKGDTLLRFSLEGLVEGEGDESAIGSSSDEDDSEDDSESDFSDYEDEYANNDDGLFGY